MRAHPITKEELQKAYHLREEGFSWGDITNALGRTNDRAIRDRLRRELGMPIARRTNIRIHSSGPRHDPPTQAALDERERAYAGEQTFSQMHFGDPLPGRSALDKRNISI
jgi:hypothetical protein